MGWNKSTIRGFDEGWNISALGLPTATWIGEGPSSNGGGTTTVTYNSVGIGTAFATRRVFFACGAYDTGLTVVSATINGGAATVFQNGSGENLQFLVTALVSTGTTMTVVVTASSNSASGGASAVWVADNSLMLSATPNTAYGNATSATSLAISPALTTQAGGFTLFYQYVFGTAATTTLTADDSYVLDVNTSVKCRGHCNGTTARTSNMTFNESATTNIHAGMWNFR